MSSEGGGGALLIFRSFRRLIEAIQALTDGLEALTDVQRLLGPSLDRLEALERSRIHFEADVEGMLLKADGKLKAANSAEQRERQLKKANERLLDTFDPDGEPEPQPGLPVLDVDAESREAERVPAMRLAVAPNNKAHAVAAKWGI